MTPTTPANTTTQTTRSTQPETTTTVTAENTTTTAENTTTTAENTTTKTTYSVAVKATTQSNEDKYDVASIVGGSVAGLVVVAIIIFIVILYRRNHRQPKNKERPFLPNKEQLEEIDKRNRDYVSDRKLSTLEDSGNITPLHYQNLDETGNPNDETNPALDQDGYLKKMPKQNRNKKAQKYQTKNIEIIVDEKGDENIELKDAPVYGNENIADNVRKNTENINKHSKHEAKGMEASNNSNIPLNRMNSIPSHPAPPLPCENNNNITTVPENSVMVDSHRGYVDSRLLGNPDSDQENYENLKGGPLFGVKPKKSNNNETKQGEDKGYANTAEEQQKYQNVINSDSKYVNVQAEKKTDEEHMLELYENVETTTRPNLTVQEELYENQ